MGGALGNLADRLRMGRVTDFVDLGFWPIFNLADAAIVVGNHCYCVRRPDGRGKEWARAQHRVFWRRSRGRQVRVVAASGPACRFPGCRPFLGG